MICSIDQNKLYFIIGVGRSGTSLFQSIMNTFDGFCNQNESRINPGRISCYTYVLKNNDFSFLENYIKKNWTNEFFVEKTPNSILCLPQLYARFPNSKYLFLERNPLEIILSQMNFHPPGKKDEMLRKLWLFQGNISYEDLELNYEQFKAKQLLKWVNSQAENKSRFKNQITVRYENLVKNLTKTISEIQNEFDICADSDLAKQILLQPSASSQNNKYDIKKLTDSKAIDWVKQACNLWDYEYKSAIN
jgi:hypothetical protein